MHTKKINFGDFFFDIFQDAALFNQASLEIESAERVITDEIAETTKGEDDSPLIHSSVDPDELVIIRKRTV